MVEISSENYGNDISSPIVYASNSQWCVRRIIPDLIRNRGLLYDFVFRQLKGRYGNAFMGFLWAFLHPLLLTVILVFVFTIVFQSGVRGDIGQSAVDILGKLVFWQFLAATVLGGTQSLIENQNLIKKTCFPREILPLAASVNAMVNLAIGLVVVFGAHFAFLGLPSVTVLWMPIVFFGELLLALGVTFLIAGLNVRYRDFGYLAEIGLTFGFYASPVLYPLDWVQRGLDRHPELMSLYSLNPMVAYLDAYQNLLRGTLPAFSLSLLWSVLLSGVVFVVGAIVFRRLSATFADYL